MIFLNGKEIILTVKHGTNIFIELIYKGALKKKFSPSHECEQNFEEKWYATQTALNRLSPTLSLPPPANSQPFILLEYVDLREISLDFNVNALDKLGCRRQHHIDYHYSVTSTESVKYTLLQDRVS